MARPGGNPGLKEFQFQRKYNWDESCTEKMTLKLPASMKAALKSGLLPNWQEIARRAIAAELEKLEGA